MEYKIAIPSYKREKILEDKTLALLIKHKIPKEKIFIFVANEEQEVLYRNHLTNHYNDIIVGEVGMKEIRNFITNYFEEGEYIMNFDDDLKDFEELLIDKVKGEPFSRKTHSRYLLNLDKFITDGFNKCEEKGLSIFGVYPASNPFFMKRRITYNLKYIIGSCWGYINNKKMLVSLADKEDVERTLLYYIRDGGVVRFEYISPITNYYTQAGGMMEKRTKERILESSNFLIDKYPEYCKLYFKNDNAEVKLKDNNNKSNYEDF